MKTPRVFSLLIAFVLAIGFAAAQGAPKAGQQFKTTDEIKALGKLEKAYDATKAAYKKHPKDAKLKKAYVDATNAYADKIIVAQSLPPKKKYTMGLHLYREVRSVDPKNKNANNWIAEIEGIYKSMGRPIPK